jgi:hypothetical protein
MDWPQADLALTVDPVWGADFLSALLVDLGHLLHMNDSDSLAPFLSFLAQE